MKRKTKFAHTSRGGVCKKDKDTKMKNGLSKQNTMPASERLLVGKDGVLGDGHRRRAALLLCGVESLTLCVIPLAILVVIALLIIAFIIARWCL
jgi:hypothetical protein